MSPNTFTADRIMAVYVVVDIDVHDPDRYEAYKRLAAPTVEGHGGKYLVRGGAVEILEGEWQPKRFVVLEFPTVDHATEWWSSEDYAPAKKIRHETANTNMILVQGV
jgi:uncharacterized protein (DUF1330 family)